MPTGLGLLEKQRMFATGFYVTGASLLAVLVPLRFLEPGEGQDKGEA
jgi:hypothetical protein